MWKVFQKKVPETAQALTLAAAERIFYSLQEKAEYERRWEKKRAGKISKKKIEKAFNIE